MCWKSGWRKKKTKICERPCFYTHRIVVHNGLLFPHSAQCPIPTMSEIIIRQGTSLAQSLSDVLDAYAAIRQVV